MRAELPLPYFVLWNAKQGRTVVVSPADVARGLIASPQTLVGVHVLVGDGADLGGMVQNASSELTGRQRHVEFLTGLVERVRIAFEQAQVRVHARTRRVRERLGHKARMDATFEGDLLDHRAEGHDVVGNRQRIGIPQIDLILAGTRLVMRVFDRDAHLLEHVDGGAAEIHARLRGTWSK